MTKDFINPRVQISVSIPKMLLQDIDSMVNGSHIRNRSHLVHIAIVEFIAQSKIKGLPEQLTISDIKPSKTKKPPKKKGTKKNAD